MSYLVTAIGGSETGIMLTGAGTIVVRDDTKVTYEGRATEEQISALQTQYDGRFLDSSNAGDFY